MKRYQCIKRDTDDFTAGEVYKGNPTGYGLTSMECNDGSVVVCAPHYMINHFRELDEPPLVDDPYRYQESDDYMLLYNSEGNIKRGCAIASAILATLIFIAYLIITWAS